MSTLTYYLAVITAHMYGDVGAWIGLNTVFQSNLWEWVDNHPVTYTNWGQGEPNNNYNVSKLNFLIKLWIFGILHLLLCSLLLGYKMNMNLYNV